MQRLTFGDYNNSINISPDGSYFITTYSNAATPNQDDFDEHTKERSLKNSAIAKGKNLIIIILQKQKLFV